MGAIPTQRETDSRAYGAPAHPGAYASALPHLRTTLTGSPLAPGAARKLVRGALTEWAGLGPPGTEEPGERLAQDVTLVVSELVTNAVVHAGTDVELACRLEEDPEHPGGCRAVVVEVSDRHPSRAPRDGASEPPHGAAEYGRGLRLVAALADAWGVTYRRGTKTVWARLLPTTAEPHDGGLPDPLTSPAATSTAATRSPATSARFPATRDTSAASATPASPPLPIPHSTPPTPPTTRAMTPPATRAVPPALPQVSSKPWPPSRGRQGGGTGTGSTAGHSRFSPRRPTCWPGSSTRTWWPH